MTESRRTARRRSRDRTPGDGNVWLDRIWSFVARPWTIGFILIVAGLVIALAPTATVPASPSHGWWVAAYRFTNAAQGGMTLFVAASFAGIALLTETYLRRRRATLTLGAVTLMFAGAVAGVGVWFFGQADVPTSRVAVAPGQMIEAYPAIESGRAFKVMLPTRIFVSEVDAQLGKATIELRKPGEESGMKNDIFVGDPLEVNGFRVALIGMELDPSSRSAVLKTKDGIERLASPNSKVRFTPDGPEYEVRKISMNYLGVMGPAAEVAGPDDDIFWVTQRDGTLQRPLNDIQLLRLEAAPVPVFTITKTNAGGAAPIAAFVFAVGLALFLFVRDRDPRSLNELGLAREEQA